MYYHSTGVASTHDCQNNQVILKIPCQKKKILNISQDFLFSFTILFFLKISTLLQIIIELVLKLPRYYNTLVISILKAGGL